MRSLILFFAILIASLLAALNTKTQNVNENARKAQTKFDERKTNQNEMKLKKNRLNIATFHSFCVL